MPLALYALTAGAFGIGVTEFVIMGLLLDVSQDLGVSIAAAGLLISGYALGVVVGAPVLTALTGRWPRKSVLIGLMAIFTLGNLACALAIIALLVPKDREKPQSTDWRADLRAITRRPVLIGLLTTVLGYAGVFAVFTYIAPALTDITGFSDAAVSPILLVFGGGLVLGNLVGGKLADRNLLATLFGTLAALTLVLGLMTVALESRIAAIVFVGLLGATGFATVAPLQMWVLKKADGAGQSLASSFNIAAFNLGNAIGAWAGGAAIDHGPGLAYVPLVAALFPLLALGVSLIGVRLERPRLATANL